MNEEHHPCHKCKIFQKFLTISNRALACETARAIDDCYLVKAYKEIRKLTQDFPKFEHIHSNKDLRILQTRLKRFKKRLLGALQIRKETNK